MIIHNQTVRDITVQFSENVQKVSADPDFSHFFGKAGASSLKQKTGVQSVASALMRHLTTVLKIRA